MFSTTPLSGIFAALLAVLLATCATAQEACAAGSSGAQESHADEPLPVLDLHSGFWINLHHFVYQQARLRQGVLSATEGSGAAPSPAQSGSGRRRTGEMARTEALTPEERQAWTAALDYYSAQLAGQDLLFNGDMVNLKNRLSEMENCPDLSGRSGAACASGLRQELIATLERVAPVYRAHWWAEHDRLNRVWIAAVAPLVRQLGGALAQELAITYQTSWPAGRLRVDVVFYGGPFGAYTTLDPVHLTMSSTDAENQGPSALEVVFHEASHALAGAVRDAIARECRARSKPIPRDLWHALLFYTTGEIVRHALSAPNFAAGRASGAYTPYAYRLGLYSRGWQNYQRVLERYWQPYLDGKAEFDTAVARLVSNL